jgi:hypothetical protein
VPAADEDGSKPKPVEAPSPEERPTSIDDETTPELMSIEAPSLERIPAPDIDETSTPSAVRLKGGARPIKISQIDIPDHLREPETSRTPPVPRPNEEPGSTRPAIERISAPKEPVSTKPGASLKVVDRSKTPVTKPPSERASQPVEGPVKEKGAPASSRETTIRMEKEASAKKSRNKSTHFKVAFVIFLAVLLLFWYYGIHMKDSDGDGVPDRLDAFPHDSTETKDSDGDNWGDNHDMFPFDPLEWTDLDGDGHGDNSDLYPEDPTEWADYDGDGWGDNRDAFPLESKEWNDTDGDGYGDNSDAFPDDPLEWYDTDGDGHGDNSDVFPKDPTEWGDNDGDWIGDNADTDDDNDGILDLDDQFPFSNAVIRITIRNLTLLDPVDGGWDEDHEYGDVWLVIVVAGVPGSVRVPEIGNHQCQLNVPWVVNQTILIDVPDTDRRWQVDINAWDYDPRASNDQVDISPSLSATLRLTINLKTGELSGDVSTGFADGSGDGTWNVDDNDAQLEFEIAGSFD